MATNEASFSLQLTAFLARMRDAASLRFISNPDTPLIEVDEAVRSIAGFYEKTRNTLEYGERDFLRQRAIERTLRRLLNFGSSLSGEDQALEVVRELIRGGYFPNETIPETVAGPVSATLGRLFAAMPAVSTLFHDELVRFAAFEIEDAIYPERTAAQIATVAFVTETCETRLRWPHEVSSDAGHRALLFVAAHRAVLHADRSRILAAFLRDAFPLWRSAHPNEIPQLASEFERVLGIAKRTVAHPRTEQYTRAMRRLAPAFRAIDDAVSAAALEDIDVTEMTTMRLERRLDEAVQERCREVKRKLRTAAWRATLYVFFTKMIVGLAIELPYERFIIGAAGISQAFWINLLFPSALMFLVAFSARPPRLTVADRIVDDALRIATAGKTLGHVRLPRKRGAFRLTMFVLSLLILGGGALVFLVQGLSALAFNAVSIGVFLVFLSVVSLFAWRIRKPLRDLAASSGGGGLVGAALEVLVFPLLAVGRALSDGLRSVNVFVFLLDVFIESPLKVMFAVIEDWLAFLREKREQLVED